MSTSATKYQSVLVWRQLKFNCAHGKFIFIYSLQYKEMLNHKDRTCCQTHIYDTSTAKTSIDVFAVLASYGFKF